MLRRAGNSVGGSRAGTRGFTLTELMSVVAIMGVLATLALAAFHRRAMQSDLTNAKIVIRSIEVAEEQFRAENQVYLDVSATGDAGWYPQKTIARNTKRSFWKAPPDSGADAETVKWNRLNPDIRQPVEFAFKANAGLPSDAPADKLDGEAKAAGITLPTTNPVEPWYLIQARADADGDGIACFVAAASWAPEMAAVNEGE